MPHTSSAEPDHILRFAAAAGDLAIGLKTEVVALGTELDQVQRSCGDFCGPFPRLDHDLDDLVRSMDQVIRTFLDVALRFRAADSGRVWPGSTPPFTESFADFWRRPELVEALPPPLALLILIASGTPLQPPDLREIGHALLGLGQSAKSAVDTFGRLVSTPMSILSSPRVDWMTEQLARTSVARRVLGGIARFPSGPIGGAAQAGLTTLTMLEDGHRIIRDGNPLTAWHDKGVGYLADLAGAGFDASSTACANEPSWPTCITAATTGTAWVAAETWQHRAGIAEGADVASQLVMDETRRVRRLASRALDEVGRAQQSLIDDIRDFDRDSSQVRLPPVVTHAIADTVQRAGEMAGTAVHETGHLVSNGLHWLTH